MLRDTRSQPKPLPEPGPAQDRSRQHAVGKAGLKRGKEWLDFECRRLSDNQGCSRGTAEAYPPKKQSKTRLGQHERPANELLKANQHEAAKYEPSIEQGIRRLQIEAIGET